MTGRRSKAARGRMLAAAQALAEERATTFRIARRNRAGDLLTGHKLIPAGGARKRRSLIDKGAKPVLSSSEWRAIYREVGLE